MKEKLEQLTIKFEKAVRQFSYITNHQEELFKKVAREFDIIRTDIEKEGVVFFRFIANDPTHGALYCSTYNNLGLAKICLAEITWDKDLIKEAIVDLNKANDICVEYLKHEHQLALGNIEKAKIMLNR